MGVTQFTDCSPIFIVGSGRSGTTLLQLMINSHPDIFICGEIHYFDQILTIKKRLPSIEKIDDLQTFFLLVRKTYGSQFLVGVDAVLDQVKRRMICDNARTYQMFYRYMLEEGAVAKGARRYGEKTPENIRYIDHLIDIFPHAKIIHIIRDPRAVVASLRKVDWSGPSIAINTIKWKLDVLQSQEISKRFRSYYELRYEDLVADPKKQLTMICRFIGEEFNAKMLEYYKTADRYIKNEECKKGTFVPVTTDNVERWRQELSMSQVYIIQKLTGKLMEKFCYEQKVVSWYSKIISPFVLALELLKYVKYKTKDIHMRRSTNTGIIWGESETLYKMLFKAIFKLRG
ncbi:sulfotransferase family protein [Candidatus Nitrospira salsa]